jgi:hypothetical protein
MWHSNFSFEAAWNIPVTYRRWFINRTNRELQKGDENDASPNVPRNHTPRENQQISDNMQRFLQ